MLISRFPFTQRSNQGIINYLRFLLLIHRQQCSSNIAAAYQKGCMHPAVNQRFYLFASHFAREKCTGI